MASEQAKPVIRIAPNNPIFDLPVLVALEGGLFDETAIEVCYSAKYEDRSGTLTERDVLTRLKESLYECGSADAYNLCEWGGIDRVERTSRDTRIVALRAAVAAQAIVTFDQSLQVPTDLADVPVAINEFTGSHYTTLQILEGAVGRDKAVVEHIGAPQARIDALRKNTVRAATLMEPFISLALKEGAHLLAATFYRGAEVISSELSDERRQAYLNAINKAVDQINADFGRYAHYIVEPTNGKLAPEELNRQFVRYGHIELYDSDRFGQAYSWMQRRGLSSGKGDHATIVGA